MGPEFIKSGRGEEVSANPIFTFWDTQFHFLGPEFINLTFSRNLFLRPHFYKFDDEARIYKFGRGEEFVILGGRFLSKS